MGRSRVMSCLAVLLAAGTGSVLAAPVLRAAAAGTPLLARGGTVVVKVTDYDPARERVVEAARGMGAELLSSRVQVDFQGKKVGRLRFRLPAEQWARLLPAARGVGKVYAESLSLRDRTSEAEELGRRIDRLREHEQRLAAVLESPRRMRGSDILYLQERLFRASVDEAQLAQRRVDLERAARAGTLVVELFEPEPRRAMDLGNWYAGSVLRARTALYRTVAHGVTAGAFVLAFAPLWVPGLALAVVLGRWLWRRGRMLAARIGGVLVLLAREVGTRWPVRGRRSASGDPVGA